MKATACLLVLSMALLSTAALADVPGLINYQGTLTDDSGTALDTTVSMTFSIFTDSTAGSVVWTEDQSPVLVSSGIFHVLLGSVNSIPDTVFSSPERWLGVQVGADPELEPRQRIVTVGYAFRSAESDTASYARNAPAASDGDWTVDGDNIYRLDGNIGIGKDNPYVKLDIVGSTRVQGGLYVAQLDSIESLINIYNPEVSDWELVAASDADRFDIREYGGGPSLSIEAGGNVGIGTTAPEAKLDVQGTLKVGQDDTGYDVNFYGANSGGRFFWAENKMALRAGLDSDGSHWAPDSIGRYSLATGLNTKARGFSSIAMGSNTTANANYSTAMGLYSTASGEVSTAMGHETIASGSRSTAIGYASIASGQFSIAMGHYTTASGDYSAGMGRYLSVDTTDAIILGSGIDRNDCLVNNIPNSLMVGFSDTTAILFVGGADHRVGIGTTSPERKLHVSDVLRLEPRSDFPLNPDDGDLCVVGDYHDRHIFCYLDGAWKQLD